MKRSLCVVCGLLILNSSARAQDLIRYWDRTGKKEASVSGNIFEETAAHVAYKGTGTGPKEIASQDIIDITYDVPSSQKPAQNRIRAEENKALDSSLKDEERRKALVEAIKGYQEFHARLTPEKAKYARRHAQFKMARLHAILAEDAPTQADAAIDALTRFTKDHPDSWQIIPASKLLAKLQQDKKDSAGAQRTYEDLAAIANLPREAREVAELRAVQVLIEAKDCAGAEKKLNTILKSVPKGDPLAARVQVYLAECLAVSGKLPQAVSLLEGMIALTTDKELKAVAYNGLGDCYRLNGRPRDALWPYLWVDVIYHQDREEHIKAMTQLAQLFKELGDRLRAQQYRDKLRKENR